MEDSFKTSQLKIETDLKNSIVVFDNSVGWTPEDRKIVRKIVGIPKAVKTAVTLFSVSDSTTGHQK